MTDVDMTASDMTAQPAVALVVAAGSGSRLGAALPKAFLEIAGRTMVEHSCRALVAGGCSAVVVVAPESLVDTATGIVEDLGVPAAVVAGGLRRQDSVTIGLDAVERLVPGAAAVLVHDAARPFVPVRQVRDVLDAVRSGSVAVVPALPVIDSIRRVHAHGSEVVDRSDLVAVQTPQGFRLAELRAAHASAQEQGLEVTDDAAVCEAVGHAITLVPGSREAMKVTEPWDLRIAELLAGAGLPDAESTHREQR